MTKDKDFKQRVRARMAKTGERYTAARASLAPASGRTNGGKKHGSAPPRPGGQHGETFALRTLLAAAGVQDPRTGEAFSEEMLLGIGGGLGFAYFVFEYKGHPPTLYIGTRVGHQYPYTADFATTVLERLGVEFTVHETGGKKAAASKLDQALDGGRAALAWVDMAGMPYRQISGDMGGALPHVVVVTGPAHDDGDALSVLDISAEPFSLSRDQLAQARARLRKAKNRLIEIAPGSPAPTADDLAAAVRAGIATCVDSLRDGALVPRAAGNFGFAALEKWLGLVNKSKNKKGWPTVFRPGLPLYTGLRELYFWIEASGTGGGGFRPMYAEFLAQAADILELPALRDLAGEYRGLGRSWSDLARAALPDGVALLAEARELLDRKRDALRDRGPASGEAIRAANQRLDAIKAEVADAATAGSLLDDGAAQALYSDLEARLRDLLERERAAADRLAAAIA